MFDVPLAATPPLTENPVRHPVETLNSACFCISLNEEALCRALETELGAPGSVR